jgi:serine protease Do
MLALAPAFLLSTLSAVSADEEKGYLGVSLAHVKNLHGSEKDGVYISEVFVNSGADAAGLEPHDRILIIEGKPIKSHGDIGDAMDGTRPGDTVQVTVRRGREEMSYDVLLGERSQNIELKIATGPHWVYEFDKEKRPTLGVRAMTLNPQLAAYFDVSGGALVMEVPEKGPAWQAGLRAGDVIVGWNGSSIDGMDALHEKLSEAKSGDLVDLEVRRRDRVESFTVALGKAEEKMEIMMTIDMLGHEHADGKVKGDLHEKQEEEDRP